MSHFSPLSLRGLHVFSETSPASFSLRSRALFRPRLEELENRLTPSTIQGSTDGSAPPGLSFNNTIGTLSLLNNPPGQAAEIAQTSAGGISVTIAGQVHSSQPNSPFYDANLLGLNATSLHAINLTGGDALTLDSLNSSTGLAITSDGSVTVDGNLQVGSDVTIKAATLDVQGNVSAQVITFVSSGLLNIEAKSNITGKSIAATADYFISVGQIQSASSITINSRDVLNAGTIDANGPTGGTIQIDFSQSYIDTASALATSSGISGDGGQVTIDGGTTGRLFSSGHFAATGANGGAISLFGQDIELVAGSIDASGSAGNGGNIRVGGDTHGSNPNVPNAQTVNVTPTTLLNASGSVGGHVVVWSEQTTDFLGNILAQGSNGSSGGSIEVSSHNQLNYGGSGDAGKDGTLLLDPKYLVIDSSTGVFPQFKLINPGSGGLFGKQTLTLISGNIIVTDPIVNNFMGAVYLFNGQTGALISTLVGSTGGVTGDEVGSGSNALDGVTELTNGNFVVNSPLWSGGKGAATWGSGTTGISGVVSASNSLVGSSTSDNVPIFLEPLSNGNYVVGSPKWNGGFGAATWGSGTTGVDGTISAANSLIGSASNDQISSGSIFALKNGNYVVSSQGWNGDLGAATWGNGATGTVGTVSASNSLVGSTAGDLVSEGGVTALTDGNYVVKSPTWNLLMGAATWGNGASGISGTISASNSLIGSNAGNPSDSVLVTELSNSNYVVYSPNWSLARGAATWGNGATGVDGTVSASNSLVGSTPNDEVGSGGVAALTNGNYVVLSPNWTANIGAATFGNGATGIVGTISSSNSLVGSVAGDMVGGNGVAALSNGTYVVCSPNWNAKEGAATWSSGTTGVTGTISAADSLVGTTPGDQVGSTGVTPLTNGNYVVTSPDWNVFQGAATWGSGTTGVIGAVSSSNSLIGSNAGATLTALTVTALGNGNYVVSSPNYSSATGEATWGNGTTGIVGTITPTNSLIGSAAGDRVSSGGVLALNNGNYVVDSPNWNLVTGAATWADGTNGVTIDGQNVVTAQNSVVGSAINTGVGATVRPGGLSGSFVVAFPVALNGGSVTVGEPNINLFTYATASSQTVNFTPAVVTRSLNAGTNVVLQANDDITINSPIIATPTGTAGSLTLMAGRSILINANITTAGGNLTLIANDSIADGVVDSQRDPGIATITMQKGMAINLGAGTLSVNLMSGTDKTNNGNGVVTLLAITANTAIFQPGSSTYNLQVNTNVGVLNGAAYNVFMNNVKNIQAFGKVGDVAYLYDTSGSNSFVGYPTYGTFSGSGFYIQAVGFTAVNAFGAAGTNDTGYLYDGSGNNAFVGTPGYSHLQGLTYFNQVVGFKNVTATATTPTSNDAAYFFDFGGTNTFIGGPTLSSLQGSGYFYQAVGFVSVDSTAGTGANDTGYLFGNNAGQNVYIGTAGYGYMYGHGFVNDAVGFKLVSATGSGSTSGDVATLYDGTGTNTFAGQGSSGTLTNSSFTEEATSFNYVNIVDANGTSDQATTNAINYTLTKYGTWH